MSNFAGTVRAVVTALGAALGATGAGQAHAVALATDGAGQVLVYPYYNVQEGKQTVFSVTNTADQGKALKLRFSESLNGRTVLEFNLYLDAGDHWSASLFPLGSDGAANLTTTDDSCTVPQIRGNALLPLAGGLRYVPFRNINYSGARADRFSPTIARTREGTIEIIEMGTLVPGSESARAAVPPATGQDSSCATLRNAWATSGYWTVNPSRDLGPPGGGLVGAASIVDVDGGTLFDVPVTALDAFRTTPMHGAPGSDRPTLADAQSAADGSARANVTLAGRAFVATYPADRAIDAVSAVIQSDQLLNEFVQDPAIGAATDFVVTLPTRSFYADRATAIAPFASVECEPIGIALFDRAGQGPARACPAFASNLDACEVPELPLCRQASVYRFGSTSALAAAGALPVNPGAQLGGHARVDLGYRDESRHALRPSLEGHVLYGLPAVGFAATRFSNGGVRGGVLASYARTLPHRAVRRCVQGNGGSCTP